VFRQFDEDPDDKFLKGGSIVRLLHTENRAYLHSDSKLVEDESAECYFWTYGGKSSDLEAVSVNSLFQIEVASPYSGAEDRTENKR
jgi:hypothetical protein